MHLNGKGIDFGELKNHLAKYYAYEDPLQTKLVLADHG